MPANICITSRASSFLLIFLIFTCTLISTQHSEAAEYQTRNIEDPDLCSSVTTKKILLDKRDKPGLIVRQSRLNYHPIQWVKNSVCTFKVVTHPSPKFFGLFSEHEVGVFAVIQDLVFRKNETANECIDYVQFKLSNGQTTQKFCGILNTAFSMDHRFQDPFHYSANGIGTAKSQKDLEVIIFISKEPLQEGETMNLEIAFTLYTDCSHEKDKNMHPCTHPPPSTCIPRKFFNDSIVNCPYLDCVDEGGCSEDDVFFLDDVQPYYGTKVLIGSVSFLFLIFGAFVCFLWLCKKHKVLCWADEFAHPSRTPASQATRVMEMEEQAPAAASAPVPPPEEDKPPSYESLFPSR